MLLRIFLIIGLTFLFGQPYSFCSEHEISKEREVNRFDLAGISDKDEFFRKFSKFRKTIENNDVESSLSFFNFPISVLIEGKKIEIIDMENALKYSKHIFSEKLTKAVLCQDQNAFFVTWRGVMIGDGEVWFGLVEGQFKVIAVNP